MIKYLPHLRFATAFALILSIVWQVTDRILNNLFRPGEYFAYFTIQSSLVAAVVLTVTAIRAFQNKQDTKTLTLSRLSVSTYAIVVAIVYNTLLRGTPVLSGDPDYGYNWPVAPNEILHVWAPLLILLDFALTITTTKLKFKQIFWALLFPLAWLIFTIIRGLNTDWWAYWFLNPNEKGGVNGVITFVLAIVVFMLVSASVSLLLNRFRVATSRQ